MGRAILVPCYDSYHELSSLEAGYSRNRTSQSKLVPILQISQGIATHITWNVNHASPESGENEDRTYGCESK